MAKKLFLWALIQALVAVLAPTVSAEPVFRTADGEFLEGNQAGSNRFLINGIGIECGKVIYRGPPTIRSTTLELEPEYEECSVDALNGMPTRFYQERCLYVMHRV